MTPHTAQKGLSIIEIMVALVLSSLLILGVTQVYLDNKRSYVFQQSQSENQEGSRYTLLLLQQELAKAGYRRRPDQLPEAAFPASNVIGCNFSSGQTVRGDAGQVCIRYQPSGPNELNCRGNPPHNAADLDEPYTSSPEIIVARLYRQDDALLCDSIHTNPTTGAAISGTSSTANVLLTGLAGLRFQFGIGSASDARSIHQYTDTPTTPILAVRYTALLRSTSINQREATDVDTALAHWSSLSGTPATELTALKDDDRGQLYHVSQSTVMLRNLMP